MTINKRFAHNRGGGLASLSVGAVLVLTGTGLVGVAIASQREAPPAPPSPSIFTSMVARIGEISESGLSTLRMATARSSQATEPVLATSKPVGLHIPAIDVRSVVQQTGQAANGSIQAPAPGPHYDEAAWYKYSPTPGSLGPAVILGHVDSAANGPSVFYRLGELRRNDRVKITRADGSVAVFVVDAVHRYSKDKFPTQLVYGDIDHAGLRIVTCGGAFDDTSGHYLDNVVVFASLEREGVS